MNKGKKEMKKNKQAKFKVKGPEEIEDGLMDMGRAIEAGGPWTHPEMERIPEWRGADIRITSDFERNYQEPGYFDHELTVRTRHAGPVTWFVFQMRDSVRYVLALYQGVVKEVYAVAGWEPANWRAYRFRAEELEPRERQDTDRWQFDGFVAKEPIRSRYLGKDVSKYLAKGGQNPIQYVNC